MELIFLMVLPAALWAHAWYMLGLYTNPRSLGILSAAVALILTGLVIFQTPSVLVEAADTGQFLGTPGVAGAAITTLVAAWAIYAAMLAGVTLWGYDERTLGFYSLFLWVVTILFAGYYLLGGELLGGDQTASVISGIMGSALVLLSILSALLFFYLGPPFARMRVAVGWFYLVISIIIAVLGGLLVLGLEIT